MLCQAVPTPLAHLLASNTNDNSLILPCAKCAMSFFLSLKKKFAQIFYYTLAHYLLYFATLVPYFTIFLTPGPCMSNVA